MVEDQNWDEQDAFLSPDEYPTGQVNEAQSPDPDGVEDPSADDTESHGTGQSDEAREPEPLPEFDPRFRLDFEGLLYLGKLSHEFSWWGHTFVIRSLNTRDVLEVGMIHQRYLGSLSDVKAYQAAVVALCLESVDGRPLPIPLSAKAGRSEEVRQRFEHVLDWHPPVLDAIYEQYLLLEGRVGEVLDTVLKAEG